MAEKGMESRKILLIVTILILAGLFLWAFIRDKSSSKTLQTSNSSVELLYPTAVIDYSGLEGGDE